MSGSVETKRDIPLRRARNTAECDALVIGGGPAGSTIAALLAQRGWSVTVLEKDRHPRFHIGESLLPMNLPIFERLGVLEQVREMGMLKPGIDFRSHRRPDRGQTFYFERADVGIRPYAFQVRRSEFDHLLLRNCAEKGAEVREGMRVTAVSLQDGGCLVHARNEAGDECAWRSRFLVDASGRNAFLATRLGMKKRSERHNSAAIFGHFENVERRSGRDEGNIGIYWFEHGWFWMIPLKDGTMSVGAVCWPDYLKSRTTGVEEFLWRTIELCPGVKARMTQARLLGEATATGNYSYESRRMWGDGYLLLGDAFAFVDPVFSTGVYLAMNSAEMAVEAVEACLRSGRTEAVPLAALERKVRHALRRLSWFIYRFTTPAIHEMFMAPRSAFGMERAIISILAGRVFGPPVNVIPILIFKAAYYLTVALNWGRSQARHRRYKHNLGLSVADNTGPGRVQPW